MSNCEGDCEECEDCEDCEDCEICEDCWSVSGPKTALAVSVMPPYSAHF